MKINEIVTESVDSVKSALKTAIKSKINNQINKARESLVPLGYYELYDIMQAVASADGVTPPNVTKHYWNHNAAQPYTKIEAKMLRDSYTALGIPWDQCILDLSTTPPDNSDNSVSPIKEFKGYKR